MATVSEEAPALLDRLSLEAQRVDTSKKNSHEVEWEKAMLQGSKEMSLLLNSGKF